MDKVIYISGKMSGMDEAESRSTFLEAQRYYEAKGYKVVNPWSLEAENISKCKEWADFIMCDLSVLKECDMIAMLPNWKDSWGAKCEYAFANGKGLDVVFYGKDKC